MIKGILGAERNNMIYITGDTHGDWISRLNPEAFPEGKKMNKNDYVIVCGDFGIWHDTADERARLKWLREQPFTTLFADGNHENFDRLDNFEVSEWNGGKIHKINDSVFHLMRGQVFEIEKLKFFVFGGAPSHDIWAGILEPDDPYLKEKMQAFDERGALYRVNHVSWWAREIPSDEEMKEGLENLARNNNKVDFIISHSPHLLLLRQLRFSDTDPVAVYLQQVRDIIKFRQHFFGHMHVNENFPWEKAAGLYEQIIRIA